MVRVVSLAFIGLVSVGCDAVIIEGRQGGGGVLGAAGAGGNDDEQCPVCPAGYTPVGTECLWFGGPKNGDFSSLEAWEATGSVFVDTAAEGFEESGVARFPTAAVCDRDGLLRQTFEMPSFACSEPLALEFNAWNECPYCFDQVLVNVDLDDGRHRFDVNDTWPARICLGERAYGHPLTVTFSTAAELCYGDAVSVLLDGVDMVQAAREPVMTNDDSGPSTFCPPPGEVFNGDFEAGMPGWRVFDEESEVAAGHGVGGTRGARITGTACRADVVHGSASLPMHENTPNPALELWVDGAASQPLVVSYGGRSIGAITPTAARRARLCVPRWAQGVTEPLSFGVLGFPWECGAGVEDVYRIDDLRPVTDAACPADALIFDGGFEELATAQDASPWWRGGHVEVSSSVVKEGLASLMLELGTHCEQAAVAQTITIPAGAPRPALRFHYRTENLGNHRIYVNNEVLVASPDEWREHVTCFDAELADTPQEVAVTLSYDTGSCGLPPVRAYFDDFTVEVNTDRPCQQNQ